MRRRASRLLNTIRRVTTTCHGSPIPNRCARVTRRPPKAAPRRSEPCALRRTIAPSRHGPGTTHPASRTWQRTQVSSGITALISRQSSVALRRQSLCTLLRPGVLFIGKHEGITCAEPVTCRYQQRQDLCPGTGCCCRHPSGRARFSQVLRTSTCCCLRPTRPHKSNAAVGQGGRSRYVTTSLR